LFQHSDKSIPEINTFLGLRDFSR